MDQKENKVLAKNNMLKSLELTESHIYWDRLKTPRLATSLEVNFKPGVNVIASPNGSGKSTLMQAYKSAILESSEAYEKGIIARYNLGSEDKARMVQFFEVNEYSPDRMLSKISPFDPESSSQIAFWMGRRELSHGQSNSEMLKDIKTILKESDAGVVFIDEPELALDPDNLMKFIDNLNQLKENHQFVIISHHPFLVLNQDFNVIKLDIKARYQERMRSMIGKLPLGL